MHGRTYAGCSRWKGARSSPGSRALGCEAPTPTGRPAASPCHSLEEHRPARLVAAVGVVVEGEEVPGLVEHDLLGVAEPVAEHLQAGAVELAAEDRARPEPDEPLPLRGLDVEAAVAHREVETAVGTDDRAVEVVPEERDPEPVPRAVALALLRDPVTVRVHELPHVRDAREPDLHSAVREHLRQEPRTDPRRRVVEAGREDGRFVRFPIAVDVHQPHDPLGLRLELLGVSLGTGARYIATRSATVRDARSSSSQSM